MPFYQKRGKIPSKRHTQFLNENGDLYWEELFSRGGFSHIYSNVYHLHPPTAIKKVGDFKILELQEQFQTHQQYKTANTSYRTSVHASYTVGKHSLISSLA